MKFGKRFISLALALIMVFGLTTGASAATVENIKVQLSPNITVKLDGEAQTMADVNGNPVYPVLNGGTTYLPVRAVSNMLGIGVDWDGATQTVLLDTSKKVTPTKTDGKTPASAKPSEITVQLSPNITVKLDGKAQSMTDVNGNPVYPLLYEGTTYLPIRAVANMLGLNVDWNGTTQTVLLGKSAPNGTTAETVTVTQTHTVTVSNATVERIRKAVKMFAEMNGWPESIIEDAIAEFEKHGANDKNGTFIYTFELEVNKADTFKTSEGAITIGDKHVACDYAEVDYSTADEGYVKVKLTGQPTEIVYCFVEWVTSESNTAGRHYPLKLNQWVSIPLLGGSDKYRLTIQPKDGNYYNCFKVAFDANIEDPDAWTLISHVKVDFENAPKTVAKAAELTKNCKTDSEKITAIFNWVATNIKYDHKLGAEIEAWNIKRETGEVSMNAYFKNGTREYLALDDILSSKSGVCEDYATLMAGMLRSLGIPCKVVSGDVYTGETIKGYNDDNPGWMPHAWVSVSPDTEGLNMTQLGAGHDEDDWIRLDPTWGGTSSGRAKAAVDKNHETRYVY